MDRDAVIEEILTLEDRLDSHAAESVKRRRRRARSAGFLGKLGIMIALGPRLYRSMDRFYKVARERSQPILGRELAAALDAASRKLIGYKRWLLAFGLLAALPGILSVVLLWQQSAIQKSTQEAAASNARAEERIALLNTIYSARVPTQLGFLNSPTFSAQSRRDAVLRLVARDAEILEATREQDELGLSRIVDISRAPLRDIDFSPLPGEPEIRFEEVGFVASDFDNTSFQDCVLRKVLLSSATLWHTDFRNAKLLNVYFDDAAIYGADFTGAEIIECNFEGAQVDATTKWPEGFDPFAHGAVPMKEDGVE